MVASELLNSFDQKIDGSTEVASEYVANGGPDQKPLPMSYMEPMLQSLITLLIEEQEHLNAGKVDTFEVFAKKKMQALAQLNVLTKKGNTQNLARIYERELRQIEELLKENTKKLKFRMKAIGEITDMIESAVSLAESDGTYQAGSMRASSFS